MYLALVKTRKKVTYILRQSLISKGKPIHCDLFDLGPSPGAWIDYPGGNAWHLDHRLETMVSRTCQNFDSDELERLFRPWIRPDIRRAVEAFWNRSGSQAPPRLTEVQKQTLARTTHAFDKRRAHFLKFGNMDQGPLPNMPAALFKNLQQKSRDEIEQGFMAREKTLKAKDLKSYVYTIFNLHSFFQGFMAKQMPHAMDQNKVDACFLKEICRTNKSLFGLTSHLDPYLIRYVIMFFDNDYADTVLLEEMERAFRFRRRSFTSPRPKAFSGSKARSLFNLSKEELTHLNKRTLTKIYRRLARAHHPDRGGSHDRFVEINEAYQILLERIR
ncbi:MAG: J domain-containing protein [Proteobacteria bacterium]|nr:J domain-containing protein [Pseudomonadota bacterium]